MPVMLPTIVFSLSLVVRNPKSSHDRPSWNVPVPANTFSQLPAVVFVRQPSSIPAIEVHAPVGGAHPIEVIVSATTTETSIFKFGFIFAFHIG